jgi:hypothetical protein
MLLAAIERILLTLWAGSLWITGYIVAPVLFAKLDDRALAGSIAGNLFVITAYLGLVCGGTLLVLNAWAWRCINWRALVLVLMLLLVGIGQFAITPIIAELRLDGLSGTARFAQLHGLASSLFVVTSVLALALVGMGQPLPGQSLRSR